MGAGEGEMRVQLVIRRLCGRPAWNNNVIPCTENNRGIVAPRRAPRWPRRFTTPWKWKGNAVRSPSRYGSIPTSGKRSPTACLMLGQRRRRWPNIEHAVGQRRRRWLNIIHAVGGNFVYSRSDQETLSQLRNNADPMLPALNRRFATVLLTGLAESTLSCSRYRSARFYAKKRLSCFPIIKASTVLHPWMTGYRTKCITALKAIRQ